ncbi:glutathione S-transferase family protein [Scleromatobacter humisilvae]|uniref:Glutathione S-transferase n=1 Tax=Scleromatobacter humisilvae TaxID=2897159 RepID=A0A9X1YG29_9BURK|nr:glutathione S-transferase [Scleromatobacter humisilvae]MCK9684795.1 glutathione S-transferase [Scleromatobacter humisilvae]
MLRILGKPTSINVRKVLWLCEELALPYAHENWGGDGRSLQEPEFLALNPNAMVPVVVDGDAVLWESNTICRYLAGRHGRDDLLPRDALARARVEQWMDWQGGDMNNAWRHAYMGLVRQSPAHQDAQAIAASIVSWNRHVAILERQLEKSGDFVTGPTFTLADIVLGLSVNRWFMTPIERPALPRVQAYYDRLATRPGFRLHGRNGMP